MMYDCDGADFDGLVNPYTGERIAVKMLVCPDGQVLFSAPGTYAPDVYHAASSVEAYRMWDRVGGKEGLRTARDQGVVCAWTGKPLAPVCTDRGWVLRGGFDPTIFRPRDEFLYYVEMDAGKSPRPRPGSVQRVEQPARDGRITSRHRQGVEERAARLDEDSVRTAEKVMKQVGAEPSPTVSMHVSAKRRR